MGNNDSKYDAPDGDDSGFKSVCPYDTFNRIRINYVEISDFNGLTIQIPRKDIKTNSKDSNNCKINELKQLIKMYARNYVTIFTDIYDTNVIQDIKFNEQRDYNVYQVIFGSKIVQTDINWHEKVYTAFINYPLVCVSEKITINTNAHNPSKTEKQLTQLYSRMIKVCGARRNKNFNPFEETLEMKVEKNSLLTIQITKRTIHLEKHLKHLKIIKTGKTNQGSTNEYNLDDVRSIINKNIQKVEDVISQCDVMINQLKQDIIKVKYNENVLENVFVEKAEDKCERIERKIVNGKFNQINETICDIEKQAQRIIEYDWKEYNMNIIKQWRGKMMEQLQIIVKLINVVNGESGCKLNDELKLGKLGEMKIGVFNYEHSFTVRLNQIGDLTGDESRAQVRGNSRTCFCTDLKSFSSTSSLILRSRSSLSSLSTSDDKSKVNEDDTNDKFLGDISNGCGCWFFIIDDGG